MLESVKGQMQTPSLQIREVSTSNPGTLPRVDGVNRVPYADGLGRVGWANPATIGALSSGVASALMTLHVAEATGPGFVDATGTWAEANGPDLKAILAGWSDSGPPSQLGLAGAYIVDRDTGGISVRFVVFGAWPGGNVDLVLVGVP